MTQFNTYTLYLDSDNSSRNFDTINDVKKFVSELMSINENQIELEKDVDVNGHSNISIKDKFDNLIRVIGFVYGTIK